MYKAPGEMSSAEIEKDIKRLLKMDDQVNKGKNEHEICPGKSSFGEKKNPSKEQKMDCRSPGMSAGRKPGGEKSKRRSKSPHSQDRGHWDGTRSRKGASPSRGSAGKNRSNAIHVNSSSRESDCSVSPAIHGNSVQKEMSFNESSSSTGSSSGQRHLADRHISKMKENYLGAMRQRSESETTDAMEHESHETADSDSNKKDRRKRKKKKKEKKLAPELMEIMFKSSVDARDRNFNSKPNKSFPVDIKQTAISSAAKNSSFSDKSQQSHMSPSKLQGPNLVNSSKAAAAKEKINQNDLIEDPKCSPEELERLEREYIFPLKKKFSKYPKAHFYCRLCDYHCDNIPVCNRHMKDSRHQKNKMNEELEMTLNSLPSPCSYHTEAITELLLKVERENGLSQSAVETRLKLVENLNETIKEKITGCELHLYGSSVNQFGLISSDVNIDLIVHDKRVPAKVLMRVYEILQENATLENVKNDFRAKIPSIYFVDKKTRLHCIVSLNNVMAQKTTRLLTDYVSIDPRVRTLGIAFRTWAKLCMIDQQNKGTLPSYSFPLMLIYFLQQQKPPVLPVLHELKVKNEDEYLSPKELPGIWKCQNKKSVGELWVELFKFYSTKLKLSDIVISIRQKKTVPRGEKNWSGKKIALEDPFAPKRNLARTISNLILFDYILERFKMTYKYFGIPQTKNGPLFDKLINSKVDISPDNRRLKSNQLLQEVFENLSAAKANRNALDIDNADSDSRDESSKKYFSGNERLRNYSDRFNDETLTVTIEASNISSSLPNSSNYLNNSESKLNKNQKNSSVKQENNILLENTSSCKNNQKLTCSPQVMHISEKDIQEYLALDCQSRDDADSEISGSTPQDGDDDSDQENCIPVSLMEALDDDADDISREIFETLKSHPPRQSLKNSEDVNDIFYGTDNETTNSSQPEIDEGEARYLQRVCIPFSLEDDLEKFLLFKMQQEEVQLSSDDSKPDSKSENDKKRSVSTDEEIKMIKTSIGKKDEKLMLPSELQSKLNSLRREDFHFEFQQKLFTGGKFPAMICAVCQKEGHLKQDCPEEKLPELKPLPPKDKTFMETLSVICRSIFVKHNPTDEKVKERKDILNDLLDFIKQNYDKNAHLELFGSSCNGFGFANSDLDICLTFANKSGEDLKCVKVIETLAEKLKKHKGLYNVIAITTAKVPIVKFTHRSSNLEGDICTYNTLAQHNTRMLNLYSEIDSRVKILGYTMKHFAKTCDIGDASRGSLSSYAYILMVIYYLQQRKPPVVPVLQELYDKSKPPPDRMVDGWNAWFFEDMKNLKKVWPELGKNKENVGELWLGLLRFYTEEFNFQELVISIRQLKPLTRFEKLWNSKCIAIEDPFDLDHNLGAGVSRKMNSYIMKAFIKGRHTFGHPPADPNTISIPQLQMELFHPENLTDGAPPNDRGCRLCGKIGHMMKDCPRRRNNKEREKSGKDQNKEFISRAKKVERGRQISTGASSLKALPRTDMNIMMNVQRDRKGLPMPQILPQRILHPPPIMNLMYHHRQGNSQVPVVRNVFPVNASNCPAGIIDKQPNNPTERPDNISQNKISSMNPMIINNSSLAFNNGKFDTIVVSNSSLSNPSIVNTSQNSSINFPLPSKNFIKPQPQVQYNSIHPLGIQNATMIPIHTSANFSQQQQLQLSEKSNNPNIYVGMNLSRNGHCPNSPSAEIISNSNSKLVEVESTKNHVGNQKNRIQMIQSPLRNSSPAALLPTPITAEEHYDPDRVRKCFQDSNIGLVKSQPSPQILNNTVPMQFPQGMNENLVSQGSPACPATINFRMPYAQKPQQGEGQIHLQALNHSVGEQSNMPHPNISSLYVQTPTIKLGPTENGNVMFPGSSGQMPQNQPQRFGGNGPPPFPQMPQQFQRMAFPCFSLVNPMPLVSGGAPIMNPSIQQHQKPQQISPSPSPPSSLLPQPKMVHPITQSLTNPNSSHQSQSSRTYAEVNIASSPKELPQGFRLIGNSLSSSHNSLSENSHAVHLEQQHQQQQQHQARRKPVDCFISETAPVPNKTANSGSSGARHYVYSNKESN